MSETNAMPVGVFDSGIGGVSVLKKLCEILPHENFLYFGDSAYAPYGGKSREEVLARSKQVLAHLLSRGAKAVVIACNTATSASADILRREHPSLPIVGMEPAIKPAALSAPHPRVLVMATEMTLRLDKFNALRERLKKEAQFEALACPRLVELIEEGKADDPETEAHLRQILAPYLAPFPAPDCVVLGCTHFPFVRQTVDRIFEGRVHIFDGAEGTAKQLSLRLTEEGLLNDSLLPGAVEFESSDPSGKSLQRMKKLFLR